MEFTAASVRRLDAESRNIHIKAARRSGWHACGRGRNENPSGGSYREQFLRCLNDLMYCPAFSRRRFRGRSHPAIICWRIDNWQGFELSPVSARTFSRFIARN